MQNVSLNLAVFLLAYYGLVAHSIDLHYRGPEDSQLERELEQKEASKNYSEVMQDPSSSQNQKEDAMQRADEAGILA